jgi:hypothetical protein
VSSIIVSFIFLIYFFSECLRYYELKKTCNHKIGIWRESSTLVKAELNNMVERQPGSAHLRVARDFQFEAEGIPYRVSPYVCKKCRLVVFQAK